MGFKLEDLSLEGKNSEQEIKGNYDFSQSKYLSDDRTFVCLFHCGSECESYGCGDYSSPGCYCLDHEDDGS